MKHIQIGVLALLSLALILVGGGALIWAASDSSPELYVPGAAHVAGANNTNWRTDLELRSVGTIGARVRVDLLRRDRDNTNHPSIILELNAGTAERYDDVLDLLFGYEGSATLRITTLDGEVRATSRTYNDHSGRHLRSVHRRHDRDRYLLDRPDATIIQLSASPDLSSGIEDQYRSGQSRGSAGGDRHRSLSRRSPVSRPGFDVSSRPYDFEQIDKIFARVTSEDVPDGIAISRARFERLAVSRLRLGHRQSHRRSDLHPRSSQQAAIQPMTPTPTPTGGPSATPTPTADCDADPDADHPHRPGPGKRPSTKRSSISCRPRFDSSSAGRPAHR